MGDNAHRHAWRNTIDINFIKYSIWNLLSAVSFFFVAEKAFNFKIWQSILVGLGLIIAIFLWRYFFYRIVYYKKSVRINIYGEAILRLKEAFSEIHWLRNQEMNKADFIDAMQTMCDKLKIIFDDKTKSDCAISIKIPVKSEVMDVKSKIVNICRDKGSVHRNNELYMTTVHSVFNNTCYNVILDNLTHPDKPIYYINNNIPMSIDYLNTSKPTYKNQVLPYKSELVVPIVPQINGNEGFQTLGFLCLDSDKTYSFDERYDLGILEGVAEGIYDTIKLWLTRGVPLDPIIPEVPVLNNPIPKREHYYLRDRNKTLKKKIHGK